MRVLLCTPREYHTNHGSAMNAPITCAYLARKLDDAGIETIALDIGRMKLRENQIIPMLPETDALGISVMHSTMEGARRLITLARHHKPDLYIVCGGVAATIEPHTFLGWGADCVVTGQADGNVAAVFLKQPQGVVEGIPGDISGRPLWEVHVPKPWQYPGHHKAPALPEANVMATRGCPHNCSFCGNVVWHCEKTRFREVEEVHEEQQYLYDNGVRGIFWYDDELIEHRNLTYANQILHTGMVHTAQGRCDIRDDDMVALLALRTKGLRRIMWGVESADVGVLRAMKKGIMPEDIERTLEVAHEAGIENFVYLMAGMPEEGPEQADVTAKALERWLRDGLVQHFQVTAMTPMPGTEVYEQAKNEGWLHPGDPFQFRVGGGTPWMSQAEIVQHQNRLIQIGRPYGAFI